MRKKSNLSLVTQGFVALNQLLGQVFIGRIAPLPMFVASEDMDLEKTANAWT
jgi:hypothetical protein